MTNNGNTEYTEGGAKGQNILPPNNFFPVSASLCKPIADRAIEEILKIPQDIQ